MDTKTTTRRAVVLSGGAATLTAALAATTALAAPPILAPIPAAPDPVFAALKAYADAFAEVEAALEASGVIEDSLGDDGRDHAAVIATDGVYVDAHLNIRSHGDIDREAGHLPERKLRALHAAFDAEERRIDAVHTASGLKAARAREQAAWKAWGRAIRVAAATVPTTPAGIAAFADFMRQEIFGERGSPSEEVTAAVLRTLSEAAHRLAVIAGDKGAVQS